MGARWTTYDTCGKCGDDVTLTWSGVESNGRAGFVRIDPVEIDCPSRCRWTVSELGAAYRGRSGM